MLIGYMQAKQGDENSLLAQRRALQDAGCEQLVEDLASGGRRDQREVLDRVREGDVVVVCRLECLGRSLQDVVGVMQHIEAAGAGLRSLAEAVDTTTPAGRATAQLVGNLAELDRAAVRERINTGLAAARAEGRVGGRRSKLTPRQAAVAGSRIEARVFVEWVMSSSMDRPNRRRNIETGAAGQEPTRRSPGQKPRP